MIICKFIIKLSFRAQWDANRYEYELKQSSVGRNNSVLDMSRNVNPMNI